MKKQKRSKLIKHSAHWSLLVRNFLRRRHLQRLWRRLTRSGKCSENISWKYIFAIIIVTRSRPFVIFLSFGFSKAQSFVGSYSTSNFQYVILSLKDKNTIHSGHCVYYRIMTNQTNKEFLWPYKSVSIWEISFWQFS